MWRGPEREAASPWQPCKDPAGDKNGLPTLISLSQTSSWCSLPLASLSQEPEGKGSPLAQPRKARARGQLDRMQRAPGGRGMQHPRNRTNTGGKGAHSAGAWAGLLPPKHLS